MIATEFPVTVWLGTFNNPDEIAIEQNHEGIYLKKELALELARIIVSICNGEGADQAHTIPKVSAPD